MGSNVTAAISDDYLVLFAHSYPITYDTLFTNHVTTPMKLTMAPLSARHFERIVPPAAAQCFTIVYSSAGFIAISPSCSQGVYSSVSIAEVRRLFIIH